MSADVLLFLLAGNNPVPTQIVGRIENRRHQRDA
jgi:hypothetical protein